MTWIPSGDFPVSTNTYLPDGQKHEAFTDKLKRQRRFAPLPPWVTPAVAQEQLRGNSARRGKSCPGKYHEYKHGIGLLCTMGVLLLTKNNRFGLVPVK